VAALPSVIGEHQPPETGPDNLLSKIRSIAVSLTGKNWKARQSALLALLPGEAALTA